MRELENLVDHSDTIIALATPPGRGAISVLRLSGQQAIALANRLFHGKNLEEQPGNTIHLGSIKKNGEVLDQVLVSIFKAPKSYTGENVVELSCHGSPFIVRRLIELFMENGARYARAGEFTRRAFTNGKFDLAQAEAVADLIASDSDVSHKAAMQQMRGGFSQEIARLREQLINFASLVELELDFSEEDVEFADRSQLRDLVTELRQTLAQLVESFKLGNVIKNGVPTVIAGKPNAGKSTLLNTLLNEEKAIVSEIPGTTRDFIEDEMVIGGVSFRFTDTAGLRETLDKVEAIGVQRTYEKMKTASLIIYLFDVSKTSRAEFNAEVELLHKLKVPFVAVANKLDLTGGKLPKDFAEVKNLVAISAEAKTNIDALKDYVLNLVNLDDFDTGNTVVTNARHYESLVQAHKALGDVLHGLDQQITSDFLAMDIRNSLHHLGEITGQITTDDLLGNIFSKFCIGK